MGEDMGTEICIAFGEWIAYDRKVKAPKTKKEEKSVADVGENRKFMMVREGLDRQMCECQYQRCTEDDRRLLFLPLFL